MHFMTSVSSIFTETTLICKLAWENQLPWWLRGERICPQCRELGFNPWVRKILWRRKWQPTPVFLPGESHRQRSLLGYSPRGCKSRTQWSICYTQWSICYTTLQSKQVYKPNKLKIYACVYANRYVLLYIYMCAIDIY